MCIHVYTYVYMYICMYVCICIHIYIYIRRQSLPHRHNKAVRQAYNSRQPATLVATLDCGGRVYLGSDVAAYDGGWLTTMQIACLVDCRDQPALGGPWDRLGSARFPTHNHIPAQSDSETVRQCRLVRAHTVSQSDSAGLSALTQSDSEAVQACPRSHSQSVTCICWWACAVCVCAYVYEFYSWCTLTRVS